MVERVSFDELYRRSSQYRLWSFTKDELLKKRQEANANGLKEVEKRLLEHPEIESSQIERVTVEEELKLISFHSRKLGALAKHFNMPTQVRATAISFLRKFYLVKSVMEIHPKFVLLTCLFLAAKSENFFMSINSFCRGLPKTNPDTILSLEFTILQSLQFTLLTHHPYTPLYGFFLDIQETLKNEITPQQLGKIYDGARVVANEALVSDAVYEFTPPQIALACFKLVNNELTVKYLKKKLLENDVKEDEEEKKELSPSSVEYDDLIEVIEKCQESLKSALNPSKEEAVVIDRKVQYCLAPSLILKRKREDPPGAEADFSKKQRTASAEPPTPASESLTLN